MHGQQGLTPSQEIGSNIDGEALKALVRAAVELNVSDGGRTE